MLPAGVRRGRVFGEQSEKTAHQRHVVVGRLDVAFRRTETRMTRQPLIRMIVVSEVARKEATDLVVHRELTRPAVFGAATVDKITFATAPSTGGDILHVDQADFVR